MVSSNIYLIVSNIFSHINNKIIKTFHKPHLVLLLKHHFLINSIFLVSPSSSAVWRVFVRLAGVVGRQSALHKENSVFAAPTPGRHISTSRGYRILFSKWLHQSFFYSFITILPSESGVTLDYCTIFPYTLSFRHFTFTFFFRNACTKSGSLRFSQFSGCWLILSVYIIMSFDFPFVRLFGVR
jgi:hypothetical protein